MPTIKDISTYLGVSVGTVSKGLNGAPDVSEEMRAKIIDTAVKIGYNSKKLQSNNDTYGLFVENIPSGEASDFLEDLISGFKLGATRHHLNTTVTHINKNYQQHHKFDHLMMENHYAAAFLVGLTAYDPWIEELPSTAFPTVLFDNRVNGNPCVCSLGTDQDLGIELAINHLVALGHTKIAFLNASLNSIITNVKRNAYIKSLHKNKLTIYRELISGNKYYDDSIGYYLPRFIQQGATAIICESDTLALKVIARCSSLDISVPEDLSIVGFDGIQSGAHIQPTLTTIRQDGLVIGSGAIGALENLMDGIPISGYTLQPELIIRQSTAAPTLSSKGASYE